MYPRTSLIARASAAAILAATAFALPATGDHLPLREHILRTMTMLESHAATLDATRAFARLRTSVEASQNDARWLRERQGRERLAGDRRP